MEAALAQRFGLIEAEFAALAERPLSARKTLLVATLLDDFADRAFEAWHAGAPELLLGAADSLAFRRALRAACPAMGDIFDLCGLGPDAPRLVTHAVEVPLKDYGTLDVADFMVSLYNGHTVQRVLLGWPDGRERVAREVIEGAMTWWRERGAARPAMA